MAVKNENNLLPLYSNQYQQARLAGDWETMKQANDAANAYRLAKGEPAQDASADIDATKRQGEDSYGIRSTQSKIQTPSYVKQEYTSPYSAAIDKLLSDVVNPQAFSYDHNKDPLYQQYESKYKKLGQQAMEDTLGKVSARTGGLASSYAGTAAQQANNSYLSGLSDKIPELYQLALSSYQNQQAQKRNNLGLLMGLDNVGYGRYRDDVGDAQWRQNFDYGKAVDERNFAYGAGRDRVGDGQWQQQFAYGAGRDQNADQQWQKQFSYNTERDQIGDKQWQQSFDHQKRQDEIATALERWRLTGRLDPAVAKILSLSR